MYWTHRIGFARPLPRRRRRGSTAPWLLLLASLATPVRPGLARSPEELYIRGTSWVDTLLATRAAIAAARLSPEEETIAEESSWRWFEEDYPIEWDWLLQDGQGVFAQGFLRGTSRDAALEILARALGELGPDAARFEAEAEPIAAAGPSSDNRPSWELYARACAARRARRLALVSERYPRIVFAKWHTILPSFFAYTEGQSDAQNERHFLPGAALCILELEGTRAAVRTLLDDPTGVIRDPAVSWDGERVVFAWKKSLDDDDYHLYSLDLASGRIRQLTHGLGFADYEPAFLPNGDLVFSSTRCVQTVDCWWTEVSNLYTCRPDGSGLRRLGFDQVHTVSPAVLEDGRVIYTRWDYSDRGQIFPQALFQMNPDGTGQTEFYGNNSWFPTTIVHARGIPGSNKVMAIFCGHHTPQTGELAILDPARGRQENQGAQLIAPVRPTPAVRVDYYGQDGDLFQHPFPLNEDEFLITYAPLGWGHRDGQFGIYWMDRDGRRELLACDPAVACRQPVPVVARRPPPLRPDQVDPGRSDGVFLVQDVYAGPGLAEIPQGTVTRLRVVALDFRAAGIGYNYNRGPAGDALVCTPIAIGNGSWDVKIVLGDATVREDGSALFRVPARTPLFFQALDARGHAVQTMRSWSTLQPGEYGSCVGCHESKNTAPPPARSPVPLALRYGVEELTPFYGPPRGFSFRREIQPILDRHCIECHHLPPPAAAEAEQAAAPDAPAPTGAAARAGAEPVRRAAFSLRDEPVLDPLAKRVWSEAYLALTGAYTEDMYGDRDVCVADPAGRRANWIGAQSVPEPLPPRWAGAARSGLISMLEAGHSGVQLSQEEMGKIACWIDLLVPFCGDYTEANAWSAEEAAAYARFRAKRRQMEEIEERAGAAGPG